MLILCTLSCLLSIITTALTPKGLNKFNLTLLGLISSLVGLSVSKIEDELNLKLQDLNIQSRVTAKEIYSNLLKEKNFEVTLPMAPITEVDVITDVVGYWLSQDRHLGLIAGSGSGKSYTVKHFISILQSSFKIVAYDPDYQVSDYPENVDVHYDFDDIETCFSADIQEIENRIAERRNNRKYIPDSMFYIAEECPILSEMCDSMGTWIKRISKRGRKLKMFLCVVAQNSTAENFSLQNDSAILKNNFSLLFLGTKAVEEAKRLKNDSLVEWLQGERYGRGLIDGRPCIIPSNTLLTTSNQLPMPEELVSAKIDESTAGSGLEAVEVENVDTKIGDFSEENKLIYARVLINEGYSKHRVIKLLWDVSGGKKYQELTRILNEE